MRVPSLTRRTLLIGASALGMGGLLGRPARAGAAMPRLTRRILVVDWPSRLGSNQTVPDQDTHGAPLGRQPSRFLEDPEPEYGPLQIPVLGLGTFGVQVLTTLASTRQTTTLEWLPAAASEGAAGARHLVVVAADWGEEASAHRAARLAQQAQENGCLTVAIGPVPCGCPGGHGAAQGRAELALMRPWVDCLVTLPPVPGHHIGRCRHDWYVARTQAHTWAAQMIDGMGDFLRMGMICTDLADMRVLFTHSGVAMGGMGRASGIDRAPAALQHALTGPWLDAATLARAARVLLLVTCSPDLTLYDLHEAASCVQTRLSPEAWIVFGGRIEPEAPPETLQVLLIAGGLDAGATATDWT